MNNLELNTYKHECQVTVNVDNVKNALKDVLNLNPTRFLYDKKDLNDLMLTYSFGELKCAYVVTLQKIDENNTKIVIDCSERTGGLNLSVASLQSYVTEFLNILSARLDGKSDEEILTVMENNNSDSNLANFSAYVTLVTIIIIFIILFI